MKYLIPLLLLAVSACASSHDLPSASGPVFQLNADKWTAASADLSVPSDAAP